MEWKSNIETVSELQETYKVPEHYTAGFAIGIIVVNLIYPKVPGNVANATTYPFPVLYQEVNFEIEQLFRGDKSIKEKIIQAAQELEQRGVRAIIGACGYFAHFQQDVKEAVEIPVFLSSLCQLPMIKTGISEKKDILVLAASGDDLDDTLLKKVGTDSSRLVIQNIGSLDSFASIRFGKTSLDNGSTKNDITFFSNCIHIHFNNIRYHQRWNILVGFYRFQNIRITLYIEFNLTIHYTSYGFFYLLFFLICYTSMHNPYFHAF